MKYSMVGLKTGDDFGIQHPLKYEIKYTVMTSKEDSIIHDISSGYNFSSCGFYVKLDRKYSPAIINFIMPSSFIVIIAFCRYACY